MRKSQEKKHEINDILLQGLHERNNGTNQQIKVKEDRGVAEDVERKDSYSNDTQRFENHLNPARKWKVGHLEGECKKIKPTSFEKE